MPVWFCLSAVYTVHKLLFLLPDHIFYCVLQLLLNKPLFVQALYKGNCTAGAIRLSCFENCRSKVCKTTNEILRTCLSEVFYAQHLLWIGQKHLKLIFKSMHIFINESLVFMFNDLWRVPWTCIGSYINWVPWQATPFPHPDLNYRPKILSFFRRL